MSYISLVIAVVVISILIYFLMKSKASDKRKFDPNKVGSVKPANNSNGGLNTELVKNKWSEIGAMQNSGAAGLKNALIEADKLLDYVMIQKGFSGETMGERLQSGGSAFSNLNAIWAAHKLRNQMAHEIQHDVVAAQFKQAISDLGQGIRDLGVGL